MTDILEDLREVVRDNLIEVHDVQPAVYISGGLDSATVLSLLTGYHKNKGRTIHTYTMIFGTSTDEGEKARRLADHYATVHKEIHMGNYLEILRDIAGWFDKPHYNIWPFWLAAAAKADGCSSAWVGEGADEIFGGYVHGDYLRGWAGQLTWVQPAYEIIHKKFELPLAQPYMWLDPTQYTAEFAPPNKYHLRTAFRGILPHDVLKDNSSQPPAFVQYSQLLDIPESTNEQAKERLKRVACAMWLQAQKGDGDAQIQAQGVGMGS